VDLSSFVKENVGRVIGVDGQCVALVRLYIADVLGLTQPEKVVGAIDFIKENRKIQNDNFEIIKNQNPSAYRDISQVGDICVISATKNNQYGHIGVITEISDSSVILFDQDGCRNEKLHSDGCPMEGCKFSVWPTSRIVGLLRAKKEVSK